MDSSKPMYLVGCFVTLPLHQDTSGYLPLGSVTSSSGTFSVSSYEICFGIDSPESSYKIILLLELKFSYSYPIRKLHFLK
ncbi:hypothetical protein TorRG33x02_177260 [Trema orientale]|uniref:Uncharacterized protein n=1 Tax=Trema orientale TaxID=63057 RepID=A0A2P5EM17_TREOI|nr:hypothetical protein TorRG33x02_177260 [Trema orientale]